MTGLQRDAKHRYRWNDGPYCPGVTSIIKTLDKSGPLVGWAKRETAACAVRNLPMLEEMVRNGGPEAATKWLSAIPDFQRDAAADLGTRVHILAEAIAREHPVEVTAEEEPYVTAYLRWYGTTKPKVTNAEFMVYSQQHLYGGTADLACVIGTELWLIDIKTGKNAYPETALQLAGLRFADWAGRTDDPKKYAIPQASRYGVLHVRPDGAELIPYQVTQDEFSAFLALRTAHGWQENRAPLIKTLREAA